MRTYLLGVLVMCGCGVVEETAIPPENAPDVPLTSSVGTNLTGIADWSEEWAFIDAFKASRAWVSGSSAAWDDGRALALDDSGWVRSLAPGQIARTLVLPDGHYPAGRYTVLYTGTGTLEYSGGGVRDAEASAPGRDVVVADGTRPIVINLTATDPVSYLRDVRFLMPGGVCANDAFRACDATAACDAGAACTSFEQSYATQIFHPTFLARLRGYRALRFMDWMDTNNSTVTDRAPAVTDARWRTGVPTEILAALANRLRTDVWINVPHQATDAYVQRIATTLHDVLAPGLRVYVEYSNEVWNGIFAQGTYIEAKGTALELATNGFEARLRYQSQRSVEIFRIFEQTFGAELATRVVRVLASQAANTWVSGVLLDHGDAYQHTDALAIAPYFGGYLGGTDQAARVRAMDAPALFSELTNVAVPEALDWVTGQAAVAQAHNVALVAYEAGNHLVGIGGLENDDAVNTLFDAANRDPRMKDLYAAYLEGWKARGGELLVHFVNCSAPSKWGRWGALEYLGQPRAEAPKYDAVMTFAETHPAWW